ncbi:hypothetical protein [Ralstonia condita]|jgi:2-keto-3-deoxy-6-phosphogluconate aldolase|uniref:hypothetical protein n=1 Tax=Ralstonia condita TaxID=3058600 RepID=UPI00292EDDD7|nr:hypothetical protein [Ralstonia sp. LMG 7141]
MSDSTGEGLRRMAEEMPQTVVGTGSVLEQLDSALKHRGGKNKTPARGRRL